MDLLEEDQEMQFNDTSLFFGELRFSFNSPPTAFQEELNSSSEGYTPNSSLSNSEEELFVPNSMSESEERDEVYETREVEPVVRQTRRRKTAASTKKKAAASKKRKASSEVLDEVKLPRAQLLSITSEEFDQLVENTRAARSLSKSEEAEIKRQLRLIKNRESAAASRARKRQSLDKLQRENDVLQQELDTLRAKNKELEDKESSMTRFLDSCGQLKAWVDSYSTLGGGKKQGSFKAGASLFILLFSFGLLFNSALISSNNKLPLMLSSSMTAHSASTRNAYLPGAHANLRQILEVADDPPLNSNLLHTILCKSGVDVDNMTNTMPIQVVGRTPQEIKCFF